MIPWILIAAGVLLINSCSATISKEELSNVIQAVNGYPGPKNADVYPYLAEEIKDFPREETAMLIAQLVHESGGFELTEEAACKNAADHCYQRYKDEVGLEGKSYYGRGFIQMRYGANYKSASEALGLGDQLLQNPDAVATETKLAVLTATWYWKNKVRAALEGRENQFGITTFAINAEDCKGDDESKARAQHRWQVYLQVTEVLQIQNKALEGGCY